MKNKIYKIIFVAGILIMIFFLALLFKKEINNNEAKKINNELQEISEIKESEKELEEINFSELKKINSDIIGWIKFDNLEINYPILQGQNNQEYLYKLPDGTKNNSGSIFLEAKNNSDFNDSHSIIYGHNMKNLTMFGNLKKYITDPEFYESNKYFTIYTAKQKYRYEIFAFYIVPSDDEIYQIWFSPNKEFEDFILKLEEKNNADIKITSSDKIVTLSTCSTNDNRMIVNAVRIE